ncbi:MAG: lipoprotein signal peptidase [Chitinophagaceae bacterium]|nr:lipoprotein signal peptidase [Chitinophagaceae bacterium]MCW5926137.1 lipoprotein signal peptidase [Chitinophagaceae bacterium]
MPPNCSSVKFRHVLLLTGIILFLDQAFKIWIKTNFYLGEEKVIINPWFCLHFIENEGMAYGWKLGGEWGKIVLTLFRLVAVILGTFYLKHVIKQGYHKGFIICATLIYAGAIGNLIDSMFYGLIFENSGDMYNPYVSKIFPEKGYAGFLHGRVVDMLYFPIITDARFPSWFPIWGGEDFLFFRPVFNLADASISCGVLTILAFQKKFLGTKKKKDDPTSGSKTAVNDKVQAL